MTSATNRFLSRLKRTVAKVTADDTSSNAPASSLVDSLPDEDRRIVNSAIGFTMVSPERLIACIDATRYVIDRNVEGAIVECGVWKGGSVLAMILTLQQLRVTDRDVYLFDTFEGMTEPTEDDTSRFHEPARVTWEQAVAEGKTPYEWLFDAELFNMDDVRRLIEGTGYPDDRIHFVQGRVEDTLPGRAPERVALLRLDTDWYGSTKHELEHLYPRLSDGGVLIVDDYGHWDGCRKAVDEYFAAEARPVLLSRIDYTGRIAIKH